MIEIEGARSSTGYLNGGLPGVPVTLKVHPGDLTSEGLVVYSIETKLGRARLEQAPGPQNGWNRTAYVWEPAAASEIAVLEAPAVANQFQRFVVRDNGRPFSVLLIEWSIR